MRRILSVFADDLRLFGNPKDLALHGANLASSALLYRLVRDPRLDAVELFVPPSAMADAAALQQLAQHFLPPERQGQGVLGIYPLHFLPEVWGQEPHADRAIYCNDSRLLVNQRYLRDRYAPRPMPILCDVHSICDHDFWRGLEPLVRAEPVSHDSLVCHVEDSITAYQQGFSWLRGLSGEKAPRELPYPARLDLIPHAVDTERFAPATVARKQACRQQLGLPQDALITLVLGRVTPYSKADLLPMMELWARSARPGQVLLVAGEPFPQDFGDLLEEQARRLQLGPRFVLHGRVPHEMTVPYYQAADISLFLADSVVDTAPTTLLEAMACGLPVIASSWTGTRQRVIHGETGLLVSSRTFPGTDRIAAFSPGNARVQDWLALSQNTRINPSELQEALSQLQNSASLRQRMGAAGRARTLALWSWPVVLDQWFRLWDQLSTLARTEAPEALEARRAAAPALGLPVPYHHIAGHYASGTVDIERETVELTRHGRALLGSGEPIFVYQDLMGLVREDLLAPLLAELVALSAPLTVRELVDRVLLDRQLEPITANRELVLFLCGLLWKRGITTFSGDGDQQGTPVSLSHPAAGKTS